MANARVQVTGQDTTFWLLAGPIESRLAHELGLLGYVVLAADAERQWFSTTVRVDLTIATASGAPMGRDALRAAVSGAMERATGNPATAVSVITAGDSPIPGVFSPEATAGTVGNVVGDTAAAAQSVVRLAPALLLAAAGLVIFVVVQEARRA